MIRRYSLLTIALMCAVIVSADPVSKSVARQIAKNFLQGQGKTVKGEPARAPRMKVDGRLNETAAYYVFNSSDNEGFVIVSGDDQTEQVLGYSMNGAFDEDNMPENLREWLQGYAEQIELIAAGKAVPARVPIHSESIGTRMTTTWNQGYPYNASCNFNNTRCATGCTATAVAQVMYWNRWPQSATTAIPGYTTRTYGYEISGITATTFDWDNMIDSYAGSYTSAQAIAVASLMRYVGQSVEMDYGPSSGAGFGKVIYALAHYFDYSPDVTYEKASSYTITQWDNMIYTELQQRPVVYEGYSTGGGHAFVIDGYDSSNGLYYVNWGWGGGSNGWYRLRVMDATGTGIGGSSTSDGYANNQGAIFGIRPNDGSAAATNRYLKGQQSLFVRYSDSAPCGAMYSYIYNPYSENLHFDYGLAKLNGAGDIQEVFDIAEDVELGNDRNYSIGYIPDPNYGMEAGNTYKFAFVSREAGDTEWHKAFADNKYFEVRFTTYDDYEIILHPLQDLQSMDVYVVGENRVNSTSTFNVNLLNNGEDFDNTVYVLAKKPGNEEYESIGRLGFVLEAGDGGDVSFPLTPDQVGTYYLRLAYDSEGTNVIAETSVEIEKAKFDAIGLTYGYDGDNLNIEYENNNDQTYSNYVIIMLYTVENGRLSTHLGQFNEEPTIDPNTSQIVSYSVGPLSPGDYCAIIYYDPDFTQAWNMSVLKYLYFTVDSEGKATVDIQHVSSENAQEATLNNPDGIYDLQGRRLNGKPSRGGLYIQNGKKVVVR